MIQDLIFFQLNSDCGFQNGKLIRGGEVPTGVYTLKVVQKGQIMNSLEPLAIGLTNVS